MRSKLMVVLLVLGMATMGFGVLNIGHVRAGLPHVVEGAVGPSNTPGLGNPSNPASASYYLTNKPSEPIQVEADIWDADGTDFAYYGATIEVGSGWNWADGDEVVVVLETISGVNLWVGGNYTTSSDGILDGTVGVDTLANADIEPFPTLTPVKTPSSVNVTWTGLADVNANIVNYTVYRSTNPAGPFAPVGRSSPQSPSGPVWFEEARSIGQWCYQIAVNYRRDTTGGVYVTTGRSGTVCTTIGDEPYIVSTSPADGSVGVLVDADIVVTFSERMDIASVVRTINPVIVLTPGWDATETILTLTHAAPFVPPSYTVQITQGRDLDDGFSLVPNPLVPNPWTFFIVTANPVIVSTSPADGDIGVPLDAAIVVTFSERMNIGTVTYPTNPTIALTRSWDATETVLTLTHSVDFDNGTSYTVNIGGEDLDGNSIVPGPVDNPWSFTTNFLPTASIDPSQTLVNVCCSRGSDLVIPWTMSDIETPVNQLIVWLNYTVGATTSTIAGPLTGRTSPDTYTWTTPAIDESVTIWLEVIDGAWDSAKDSSASVKIDSTVPSVQTAVPSEGATNVATDSQVVLTFSEPMQTTTVDVSFTPTVSSVQVTWNTAKTVATVAHANFQTSTLYRLTVAATAKDNCTPGNEMGTAFMTNFTTGTAQKAPMPPTNLAVASQTTSAVTLTWTAPTQYTDGSSLPASEISAYKVYRAESSTGQKTVVGTVTTTTFTDSNVNSGSTYHYWVTAVDVTSRESGFSNEVPVTVQKPTEGGLDWLWILILIIVVLLLLLIGFYLLKRRKKPEEAPPEPTEGEEMPPTPEAAPEEEAVSEEAAEIESKEEEGKQEQE